ncbi:hypothetical protein GQ464_001075 [Rhodocaloribacter litoris]|uniref:DUF6263 family protein n=1 Tax=Rhodocaloribacter litoris TaxID=2558931 RepID=UPI00141EB1C8|nr:DUF6263 family protein [Rhodocaloribacter litoris]QXD15568.1 hypothetical protein GQ464_001075 [Rhodocaloribacter litoris]GIV60971.1 MAG: hypothetical protein KatS3mg043_2060 [Rhodothermaceae bacterium]
MTTLKRAGLPLLLLVLVAATLTPEPAVRLRLNLKEGASYKMYNQIEQAVEQVVMGQEQNVKNQIGIGYRFDVLAARDQVFDVKLTYYKVKFSQEGPMGTISYDSENPPETVPPQAQGFAALGGQSLTLKLDAMGKVLDVGGVEDMIARMVEGLGQADAATRAQIEQSLRQQFGREAMSSQMEAMFAVYPEGEVAVGDTWTREVAVNAGLPLKLASTYRLTAYEGGRATLEIESQIRPGTDGPVNMGGMEIEFDISGSQKGTAVMDAETGLILEAEARQEVAGDMIVNGGAMTWPLVFRTHTKLSMEE